MVKRVSALNLSGSAIALIASMALGSAALAEEAAPAAPAGQEVTPAAGTGQTTPTDEAVQGEEIVVTGSSIRGVAPVGSNLVSVGEVALVKTAATTVTELVNTVPAIT